MSPRTRKCALTRLVPSAVPPKTAVLPPGASETEPSAALRRTAEHVDYEKHKTCAPIALIEAYWLARRAAVGLNHPG